MARTNVDIGRLDRIVRPVVEDAGFDLILVEWATDQGRPVLRLYVDRVPAGGVTVDDCATVSRLVSPVLDVEDAVPVRYALEVSTPGLDRPLTREQDFRRFVGQAARVVLQRPLPSGRKRLTGTIAGVAAGRVTMVVDQQELTFALADVAKANLVYQGNP